MDTPEIRLLALEERLLLALNYFKSQELDDLCIPSVSQALADPVKVHRINEVLTTTRVPVLSSELNEDQLETLRTGKPPEPKPEEPPPIPTVHKELNWRDALDHLVAEHPELDYVHFMLYHFLQPTHVREIHRPLLKGQALGLSYEGQLYRVVGITPFGTLQLSKSVKQGLVYDTTLPFTKVIESGEWSQLPEE